VSLRKVSSYVVSLRWLIINVLLFTGLTVWEAASHPPVAPAFGLMAVACALRLAAYSVPAPDERTLNLLTAYLILWAVGFAYLLSLAAGGPREPRFWLVFGGAAAAVALSALIWRRSVVRGERSEEGLTE
jgi:hypothetical protein